MAYNSKYTGEEVEQLLDKVSSSDTSNFAVCDSSGNSMIKEVTIEGFQLLPGVQVRIKFLNSATTSPMILNVSDTGSSACYYKGKAMHMGWCRVGVHLSQIRFTHLHTMEIIDGFLKEIGMVSHPTM